MDQLRCLTNAIGQANSIHAASARTEGAGALLDDDENGAMTGSAGCPEDSISGASSKILVTTGGDDTVPNLSKSGFQLMS